MRPQSQPAARRSAEAGYAMAALVASVTIMLIVMAAAVPSWRYVMKNDREEELLFRGEQIARAIKCHQEKNRNSLPTSLDMLVREKCLRRAYKDPMTKDGRWRLVRPGEPLTLPGQTRAGVTPTPSPTPTPSSSFGREGASGIGPFTGVASRSSETSLRVCNDKERYDEWRFMAPQVKGAPIMVCGSSKPPSPIRTPPTKK